MNILELHKLILSEGGCSYNPFTGEINPESGFMVALPDNERIVAVSEFSPKDVSAHVAKVLYEADPSLFFGAWLDNGQVYLDSSSGF